MVNADNFKPFKTNVPGAAYDNLYRDDDNDNMTGDEELHGDGETNKKLRPDDTAGSEVTMTNQNEVLLTKLVLTTPKFPFPRQRA